MEINKRNGWVSARGKRSLGTKGFQDYFVEIPESVAKESLQNAIDAALNLQDTTKTLLEYKDSDTVFSKIQVIELTNAAKKEWLEAVSYKETLKQYYEVVRQHLKSKKESSSDNADLITDYQNINESLKDLDDPTKPLIILNLTDTKTTGLLGKDEPDDDDVEVSLNRLLFEVAADGKEGKKAGSWQLGKLSYIFLSRMNMFLIRSNLSKPVEIDGKQKSIGRIRGLVETRPASIVGAKKQKKISGIITFGEHAIQNELTQDQIENKEKEFPMLDENSSIWDDDNVLSKQLYLDVINKNETGTTIQIPQIQPLPGNDDIDIEAYALEIGKQVKRYLWPAIVSKKIDVVIEFGKISKAGGIEKNNTNFKEVDYFSKKDDVDVFIDLFKNVVEEEKNGKQIFETNTDEDSELISPENFEVLIDKRTGVRDSQSYKPKLVFQKFKDTANHDKTSNTVALIRGAGIVVQYMPVFPPDENILIKGLFLGGTALKKTDIYMEAEEWHRLSEDPAHRSWWGPVSKLSRFFTKAKKAVVQTEHRSRVKRYVQDKINNSISELFKKPEIKSGENDYDSQKSFPLVALKEEKLKTKYKTQIEDLSKKIVRVDVTVKANHTIDLILKNPKIVFKNTKSQISGAPVAIKKVISKSQLVTVTKENDNWKISLDNSNDLDKQRTFYVQLSNSTVSKNSYNLKKVKIDFSVVEKLNPHKNNNDGEEE